MMGDAQGRQAVGSIALFDCHHRIDIGFPSEREVSVCSGFTCGDTSLLGT